jgi:glycosyltransferase involved in cell wall biosynthesis
MHRIGIDARLTYYRRGGITEYIEALIRELATLDTENQYFILQSRKDARNLAQGAHQKRIRCWTPAHHRIERLALGAETLPLRLNLLHSPDFIPPHGMHRSVITIHDLNFLHYPDFLTTESRRYYNDQIEAAVNRAEHIMTDSEATRQDVIKMLNIPPENVTTILLGISEHFRRVSDEKIDAFISQHNLMRGYILFVGTFEPRKNLKGLLRAYAQLRVDLRDAPPLVIAGRPGWLDESIYELAASLKLGEHLRWIEDFSHEDHPTLYSGAGVLCLPSFYEGFGFPPLEAMACGTPTVVADRASLPEVVGDAGLLIDPDRPASIADALCKVLTDSELAASMVERGYAQASKFQWHETAQQTLAIYQRVLNG